MKGKYLVITDIGTTSIHSYVKKYGDWVMLYKAIADELRGTFHYAYMSIYNRYGAFVYKAELVPNSSSGFYTRVLYRSKSFHLYRMWR